MFIDSTQYAIETKFDSAIHSTHIRTFEEGSKIEHLHSIANNYMSLLLRMGMDLTASYQHDVEALFAPECKKIVNGSVWYEGLENFIPQLLTTGERVGAWQIEPLDVIANADGTSVVVRFLVTTESAGIWNTMVILRCNNDFLITEINEIFNFYEGPYPII